MAIVSFAFVFMPISDPVGNILRVPQKNWVLVKKKNSLKTNTFDLKIIEDNKISPMFVETKIK